MVTDERHNILIYFHRFCCGGTIYNSMQPPVIEVYLLFANTWIGCWKVSTSLKEYTITCLV